MDLNTGVKELINPLLEVWNAIGYDLEHSYVLLGEPLDNISAIEACLDSGYFAMYARDNQSAKLVYQLCLEYGHSTVVAAIAEHVTLS